MMRCAVLLLAVATASAVPLPMFQASLESSGANTTMYTLEQAATSGDCGQVDIPSVDVKPAQGFDKNLKVGTCASVGYSVADGTISKKVPVIGTLTIQKFKKAMFGEAARVYTGSVALDGKNSAQVGRSCANVGGTCYSFTFTGDGCGGQCPKSGCYEQDNGCEYCLAAWRAYPPDPSYKYNPIVAAGCNGTLTECPECPPGLTRYTA